MGGSKSHEMYTEVGVWQVKEVSTKPWMGILRHSEPNPDYVPKPAGEDTRKPGQRRRTKYVRITKCFDPKEVNTKAKAHRALVAWHAEMEREAGTIGISIADAVDEYLDGIAGDVEPSTMTRYRTSAKHIRDHFEYEPLADLTSDEIESWMDAEREAKRSESTRTKDFRLLKKVCAESCRKGKLTSNPFDAVEPKKKPKNPDPDPNALTHEDAERVAAALDGMEPTPLAVGATLGLYMGLRAGEVCALRWRDVDLDEPALTVRASIGQAGGKTYLKEPKTKSGRRTLDMDTDPAKVLAARRDLMRRQLAEAGVSPTADEFGRLFVLGTIDGRYMDPNALAKQWSTLAGAMGLVGTKGRPIRFHDLRHTFATFAVSGHADVKSVAQFLGHEQAGFTLNVYADADRRGIKETAGIVGAQVRGERSAATEDEPR